MLQPDVTLTGNVSCPDPHDPTYRHYPTINCPIQNATEETSSCSLRPLIARTAVPMLALALVCFLFSTFSARSVLATPYVTRPWVLSGYCNAPHVNASHYQPPLEDAQLVHVSVMMRHHKVTVDL